MASDGLILIFWGPQEAQNFHWGPRPLATPWNRPCIYGILSGHCWGRCNCFRERGPLFTWLITYKLEKLLELNSQLTMPPRSLQIYPRPRVTLTFASWPPKLAFSSLCPVNYFCQFTSKSVHSFIKYYVHNLVTDGRTNGRTRWKHYAFPASLAWRGIKTEKRIMLIKSTHRFSQAPMWHTSIQKA